MSKQRQYKFLKNMNNIGFENENILVGNDNEFECTDTDNEEENIVNICCGRNRIMLLPSSEEEIKKNE